MNGLPVDTRDPAVREALQLTRLQVLTPLSLIMSVGTIGVCSFVISPNLSKVTKMYPTSITPRPSFIAFYVVAIYCMQVGYCVLLSIARKRETKQAFIKGSGLALVLSNWVFAFWAVAWAFQAFTVSTILLGILVILLLYSNIVLFTYHPTTYKRPLDILFIHAPVRLFLILPLSLMFWVSLFVAEGHYWSEGDTKAYDQYRWEGFGIFLAINVLGAVYIAARKDIIWTAGAMWLAMSIWRAPPKAAPVSITAIVFTFVHPVVLIVSAMWTKLRGRKREGPIALPQDEA